MNKYMNSVTFAENISEIYVYHLTRRLNIGAEDKSCKNLKELLLGESELNSFLLQYNIKFKETNNHISIIYNGSEIILSDPFDLKTSYLKRRLGYFEDIKDYCFNGFAFRDQLMKNSYTSELYNCPEFIRILAEFLSLDKLVEDYYAKSKYYCYTYKFPIDEIVFDKKDTLVGDNKIRYFLLQVFLRLKEYVDGGEIVGDFDNPIIRFDDDLSVSDKKYVDSEEIIWDMISN